MPSLKPASDDQMLWRSLDELEGSPRVRDWVEREFVSYVPEEMRSPNRRQFLKLAGASAALAGLTGCRWPREEILPHSRLPDNRIPGEPVLFATSMERNGCGIGLLATSVDGRPIKLDGNDLHPLSLGKSDVFMQAAVLDLYDPDRSKAPLSKLARQAANAAGGWAEFDAYAGPLFEKVRAAKGAGCLILSEVSDSPLMADMRKRVADVLPEAKFVEWSPLSSVGVSAGTAAALGEPMRPMADLSKADVIVSIDRDFLAYGPAAIRYAADFAKRRKPVDGKMSRLYMADVGLSLTGAIADHRLKVKPSQLAGFVCGLIAALRDAGVAIDAWSSDAGSALADAAKAATHADAIKQIAKDIAEHRGHAVLMAGAHLPAPIHAAVAAINAAVAGDLVTYFADPRKGRTIGAEALASAAAQLSSGAVQTLIILGGNPAFDAPAELKLADAIAKAPNSIHLSEYDNETSRLCTWHCNRAHLLEAWGATRAFDGTVSIVQPLIAPLYEGRTPAELISALLGEKGMNAYSLTRRALGEVGGTAVVDDVSWNRALHDGVFAPGGKGEKPSARGGSWCGELCGLATSAKAEGFEIAFRPDYRINAGEWANNPWLQELPEPLTKLTWDNAALIAPSDATRLNVRNGAMIRIEQGGTNITLPIFILPGQVAGLITLLMGYGRSAAGIVGDQIGFNVYPLRRAESLWSATGAKVSATGAKHQLVTAQDHHMMESDVGKAQTQKRLPELVREYRIEEYNDDPKGVHHVVHLPTLQSLWQDPQYGPHRWAMAIDLGGCIGCNACVVACQAENNIPVVGKQEVEMGREMHWLRIDRYFRGENPEEARIAFQPVMCQHCELAPCESVCPVAATVHDSEGLNVMVYNRCIGTRYCSNNCPFKVRRFNWFFNHHGPRHPRSLKQGTVGFPNWKQPSMTPQKLLNDIQKMQHNPEVTVRSRGVMEKCTFCIQRISKEKIRAKNEWVGSDAATRGETYKIADGTITTACQDACPTSAIHFGDLGDPKSAVSQLRKDPRSYALLAQLNVKPRVEYLARVTNPGPLGGQPKLHGSHGGHSDGAHGAGAGGHDSDTHAASQPASAH